MRRGALLTALVAVLTLGWAASATTVGIGVGIDPTNILLFNALTEMPVAQNLDLRAEIGVASGEFAGLFLATTTLLLHQPFPPIDPFFGAGVGVALTPPPYTTGLVLEGVAGLRFVPVEPISLLLQLRYLVRWAATAWTSGPVYEAAVQVRF
jgi:hypothetical protein